MFKPVDSSSQYDQRTTLLYSHRGFTQGSRPTTNLHGVQQRCTRILGTPNPDAHHSKRGGTSLTCQITGRFINRRLVLSDGPIYNAPAFLSTGPIYNAPAFLGAGPIYIAPAFLGALLFLDLSLSRHRNRHRHRHRTTPTLNTEEQKTK